MTGLAIDQRPTENLIACHVDTGMYALDKENLEQRSQPSLIMMQAEELNKNYSTLCIDEALHFVKKHNKDNETIALLENLMEITNE
jgi:predicted ATPase